jgi:preprotein translocase subunit SecB
MKMRKRPVEKMLALIIDCDATAKDSPQYIAIQKTLQKGVATITHAEKTQVRDDLRSLCRAVGLPYDRLLLRVMRE